MKFLRSLAKGKKLRTNLLIGTLLLSAVVFIGIGSSHKTFNSVEVAFTDSSQSGLAIVPASCPSNPGDADAPFGCSGSIPLCQDGSVAPNSDVNQCTCAQGNSAACAPPPPICRFFRLTCVKCLDGSNAPNNDAAQCTCAQGNAAACAQCPNGQPAPNNNPNQCSCAQGNVAACTGNPAPPGPSCPGGQHAVSNICVCDLTNLPADTNGQCTAQACPQGFVFDSGTGQCIAISQCGLPNTCSDSTHVLNQCTGAVTNCAANGAGWHMRERAVRAVSTSDSEASFLRRNSFSRELSSLFPGQAKTRPAAP
jgi:hypothetical protein